MEQSNHNPMLNTVILKNIFEVLPISDLASCRQVCKTWFEESLTRWRRDMWLKLREDDKDTSNATTLTLENFLLELNDENVCVRDDSPNVEMKTFKKFKLQGWNFNSEDNELKNQFWKTCGPLMTSLQIERSEFSSCLAFESVVLQDLPNLEELILCNNYYRVKREKFETFPPINDVLSRARKSNVRNLQVILYNKRGSNDETFPLSLLEFIANFRSLKSFAVVALYKNFNDKLSFEEVLSTMVKLSRNHGYNGAVEDLSKRSYKNDLFSYDGNDIHSNSEEDQQREDGEEENDDSDDEQEDSNNEWEDVEEDVEVDSDSSSNADETNSREIRLETFYQIMYNANTPKRPI